jgi:hypothetical protein
MIDAIPTLAWSCSPDGATEFLNQRALASFVGDPAITSSAENRQLLKSGLP